MSDRSRVKNSTGRPPRSLLRHRDSQVGSYPPVVRTGCTDKIPQFKAFNDTDTLLYTSQNASYPTLLPVTRISSSQTEITSTINAVTTIRKGVGDQFLIIGEEEDSERLPFNESFLPEQSQTGDFFLTGTKPAGSSIGFSSRLASKTQIKFEFDIDSPITMNANTASILYYNKDVKTFNLAGGSDSLTAPGASDMDTSAMLGRDAKLFGPFGLPVASSSFPNAGTSVLQVLDEGLVFVQTQSVTLNSNFAATNAQLIPLSGVLNSPFLLESVVIELPVSSSDGWFNDTTKIVKQSATTVSDAGGPAVTVGLMNQFANNKRDIILSASIIPIGDTGSAAFQGSNGQSSPTRFESFSTANAVVNATGEQKVTIAAKPTIANYVVTLGGILGAGTAFDGSFFGEVSPFGRSMHPNEPSARSFFGKEFAIRSKENIQLKYDADALNLTSSIAGKIFFYEKQEISPYVLNTSDNLVFCVAKHRPVMTDPSNRGVLTGSHEFGFPSGTIKITLYGSLVRECEEFHDTLNQNLTSDAVHEFLHYDNPVLDQFDIEPKTQFSGSYIEEFFTGSITATAFSAQNGELDGRRGRRVSLIEKDVTNDNLENSRFRNDMLDASTTVTIRRILKTPGFSRNVQVVSEDERYFDTLLPRPDRIIRRNKGELIRDTAINPQIIYLPVGREVQGTSIQGNFDFNWDFLFPFEPRYADIERTTEPLKDVLAFKDFLNNNIGGFISSEISVIREENAANYFIDHTINGLWLFYDIIPNPGGGQLNLVAPNANDVARALFCTGDGLYGEANFETEADPAVSVRPQRIRTRGFKYGITNVLPEKTKCIFRRDRYGQFRDMLEQRRDSKMFIESDSSIVGAPVAVRFVSQGVNVPGELTFSNNLSTESTSSIPYFDGIGRSRGDLPDINIVP